MLWLALEFPHLVLDAMQLDDGDDGAAERRHDGMRERGAHAGAAPPPVAVVDQEQQRRRVHDCNAAAAQFGVHAGQPLGAAQALCGSLRLVARSPARERALILRRATWGLRFSPVVSVRDDRLLLVEIDPSRRLFGGLRALLAKIRGELDAARYRYRAAAAATPAAAVLLARAGRSRVIAGHGKLAAAIGDVALRHGEWDARTLQALHGIGIACFRELFALPRKELGRRFGQSLVDYCDRLLGRRMEVLPRFEPPDTFATGMELPVPIVGTEALAFGARRLLRELGDWLEARQLAVLRCRLELVHEDHPPSVVELGLRCANADTTHLSGLLRAHLEQRALPQAVAALRLSALECSTIAAPNAELFERTDADDEDIERLIDRLRSRLGEGGVRQIALHADHRPERAQRLVGDLAREPRTRRAAPRSASPASRRAAATERAPPDRDADAPASGADPLAAGPRPLLLLDAPKPLAELCETPLAALVLVGPERIETGWWDGHSVRRDYYRAATPEGAQLWIYRDRVDETWFVHGVFG